MHRRQFLKLLAASTAALSMNATAMRTLAEDLSPADVRIVRIIAFDLPTKRVKFVGKNARLDDHGDHSRDRVVRLITNSGIDGFGVCHLNEKQPHALLDQSLAKIDMRSLGAGTAPLWDLLGKLSNKPVYQLLNSTLTPGQEGIPPPRETPAPPRIRRQSSTEIPVYDGSIYFSDLIPRYANSWQDRFKSEVDDLLTRGHRAFKVKIGRGNKWMPRDEGDARDIDVLKILRAHAGKDVNIAVDANNGYGEVDRVARLLDALPDFNFEFLEEMFPEEIEKDLALKAEIKKRNLKTLLADGETQPNVDLLKPMMEAKSLDLFQLDVNAVGIEGLLNEAALARPYGGRIAPHTWGTLLGFYAQLHVAAAIDNFYSAEQDPLSSEAVDTSNYKIQSGRCTVPDAPGFGMKLNEKSLADIKPVFDLKS